LSNRAVAIESGEFFLKGIIEEFMPVLAQKYKQLGSSNPLEGDLLCC